MDTIRAMEIVMANLMGTGMVMFMDMVTGTVMVIIQLKILVRFNIHINIIARFIIRCNEPWKFWWDVFVLILAIGLCAVLPVEIVFHPPFNHSAWLGVEYFIEAIFIIDLLMCFNTTLYDHDGNEIFDRKHIAIDYLCEYHFWVDILSIIPLKVLIYEVYSTIECMDSRSITTNFEGC